MTFQEQLNSYIEQIGISQKELADESGLSNPTISRYCSGGRVPACNSPQIRQIAKALSTLASSGGLVLREEDIAAALNETVDTGLMVDYPVFLQNLNLLLKSLDIRGTELARALNYDASHISKILNGTRKPGNLNTFITETASYIARRFAGSGALPGIARLTGIPADRIRSASDLRNHLVFWLGSNSASDPEEPIGRFLGKLDDFDLNEYLKAIHFDEIKLPPAALRLPTSKTYFGLTHMMESELDFIKTTVLSKSAEDCILYSDMPLEEMASDPEFPKKWMFGMAMLLKKGLHLHIIHDVNRPFPEMMLGLESHIPMYMTGQISPYYLPVAQGSVFSHLLKVSGAAALEGSAIAGKQHSGKYVLYRAREDIRHYRKRAADLLQKSYPLMDIYRMEQKSLYTLEIAKTWGDEPRKTVCGSLPLFTIPEDLLTSVLQRAELSDETRAEILAFRAESRERALSFLKKSTLQLIVPDLSADQYEAQPVSLSLADLFIENDILYSHEEYDAHLQETLRFAGEHPNLTVEKNPAPAFRNISYTIVGERLVIVSKEKSPAIHFVIHHKKMVQAFRNFIPPIVES